MYDLAREQSYQTPLATSPLLPLLLMSLASQQNAPKRFQTPSSIYSEYDYIIVGSGSAGSTLAARLSEVPCVTVLLLEAGGPAPLLNDVTTLQTAFFRTDLDWNYTTVPQKHLNNIQIPWFLGRGFGGTSLLNCNIYGRGFHKKYNEWAKKGATGWSYDDVLPYFKKLESYTNPQYAENGYHGFEGPVTIDLPKSQSKLTESITEAVQELGFDFVDINGPRQTGFYITEGTIRNGQRCSAAKAYLVPAESRSNLHILPFAFAHKVIIENDKAVGVSFEVDGTMHEVRAKAEVILSAGTVNSAKILMLSGVGPKSELQKHGISLVSDLPVGKNLQTHGAAVSMYELGSDNVPTNKQLMDEENIRDFINYRKGPYGSLRFVHSHAHLKGSTAQKEVDPDYELYITENLIGSTLKDSVYQHVFDANNKAALLCGAALLHPKSRGTVTLKSANPHDPPLIDPNHHSDERDVEDTVAGLKVCHQLATSESMKTMGVKPFNTTYPGCEKHAKNQVELYRCMAKQYVYTSNHQIGTAKMGDPKDPSTVVDPQLRVKNIAGLRVVDASVMPIMPTVNTNIPTIMIAEKAADMIKQDITCSSPLRHIDL